MQTAIIPYINSSIIHPNNRSFNFHSFLLITRTKNNTTAKTNVAPIVNGNSSCTPAEDWARPETSAIQIPEIILFHETAFLKAFLLLDSSEVNPFYTHLKKEPKRKHLIPKSLLHPLSVFFNKAILFFICTIPKKNTKGASISHVRI